jgi:uncharacterized membrane protein required for colicin V production
MGNIILIAVGLFMVAMTCIGLKRGMIKMAFSLVSVILVLLLVNLLTPPVKQLLKTTPIYTGIQTSIEGYVENNVATASENITQTGVSAQKKIINDLPLPKEVKKSLNKNNTEESYSKLGVDTFAKYISESLADMVLNATTFVLLFVIFTILIKILVNVLDIIAKLPVLKTFNSIGGAIIGMAESIVILWILCIVITAFSATDWGQQICQSISDNGLLSLIYDNNIIQQFVTGIFNI